MCTVTYIPSENKTFITSNRDEKPSRSEALAPEAYEFPGGKIFYPKDTQAGGTWFALHENGNVVVLMNGAFTVHQSSSPYRYSRGLVVLKLVQLDSPVEGFKKIDLLNIEPFTVIIWEDEQLFEGRWDGTKKHFICLDKSIHRIWSSATLYSEELIERRERWFAEWLEKKPILNQKNIFDFHQFTGEGDKQNDLVMNRNNEVCTVSITGVDLSDIYANIQYVDLLHNRVFKMEMILKKECVRK